MGRLRDIELSRYADQLRVARQWLAELERQPTNETASFFVEQTRRNIRQLRSASEGHTPSAVLEREDRHPNDEAAERLALARDEAAHTAQNVLTFLNRAITESAGVPNLADLQRCARWLLRLRIELLDALPDEADEAARLAANLISAPEPERSRVVDAVRRRTLGWLDALGH